MRRKQNDRRIREYLGIRNDLNDNGLESPGELWWVRSSVLRPCDTTNAIIPLGEFSSMVVGAQRGITCANLGDSNCEMSRAALGNDLIDDVSRSFVLI